jgi:dTDP-glucose 4,6-dehydratase
LKVLVTGGCGFIGSALCRYLLGETEAQVVNIDLLTYAATLGAVAEAAALPRYAFIRADVADRSAMDLAFETHKPDAVIHLAAETHVDRSITTAEPFVRTNLVGTFTLLESATAYWRTLSSDAQDRFRFLHVSTDEVYGSLGPDGAFSETSPYDPRSPYAATKAGADHLAAAWWHTHGLPVMITNCSNNYGPYHFPEKLIPLVILNSLEGRPLPVYGDGGNVRDWLYVEDHARALARVLEKGRPGATYNIGARSERTNLTVVETICDLLDEIAPDARIGPRRSLIGFVEDRPGHDRRYAIDPTLIERELDWRPRESFETGLARTVRWYVERADWWRPLQARYGRERLGLAPARQGLEAAS